MRRSARPYDSVLGWVDRLGRYADVSLHPSARVTPGVVVYRLDDRLFFANARYFKGRVREAIRAAAQPVTWLVFDAEARRYEVVLRPAPGIAVPYIPDPVAALRCDVERADGLGLKPWIPTLKYTFVRVEATAISGRAFARTPEPDRYGVQQY